MKLFIGVLIASTLAFASTLVSDAAAEKAPVTQSAASSPAALGSPAVQAAESTKIPGDVRPEKRAVPQISIPLKRSANGPTAAASSGVSPNSVDDDAARCIAQKTRQERADCQRVGSSKSSARPDVAAVKR